MFTTLLNAQRQVITFTGRLLSLIFVDNAILQFLKVVVSVTIIINCFSLILFLSNVSVSTEERGNRVHEILELTLNY